MKRFCFILLLLMPFVLSGAGKGTVRISGRVTGADSSPLQYVTVAVLGSGGTVLSAATSSDDGKWAMSVTAETDSLGDCSILYSMVGYKELSCRLGDVISSLSDSEVTVKDMAMEEDSEMLSRAVVVDKRPMIEHKFDRITLNVSELAVAQTGNALDVLKAAPGVTIDNDGNVKLNGSAVSVWIDDKPSNMSGKDLEAFLQGSSGTSIEKVELMSNPSSKYDAEGGGGIINIKTRKGFMQGFNGTLNGSYGIDFLPALSHDAYLSTNLMYKNDSHNVWLQYTPSYYNYAATVEETKIYGAANDCRQETSSGVRGETMRHNLRLGYDWTISPKDILGFIAGGNFSGEKNYGLHGPQTIRDWRNISTPDEYLYSVRKSDTNADSDGWRASANLNYTHKFDESKSSELTLNFDYNRDMSCMTNTQRNILDMEQSVPEAAAELGNYGFDDRTDRAVDIYSLKADYSQLFWNNTGRIETGLKAAYSRTGNFFGRFDYDFDAAAPGPQSEKNDFTYREQIYAAYINLSKQFSPKWSAQIGLRGEYTLQSGDWMSDSGSTQTRKDYFDVFPTAFVSWSPSQKVILTANYSYRISRPKYWQLNPFRRYVNATTYNEGNPELQPFYSHNVSLSSVLFSHLTLTAGYSMEKGYSYTQVPRFEQSTGMMGLVYDNAGDQQNVYVSAALSELPLTKWWNLTVNLTYFHLDFRAYPNKTEDVFGSAYSSRGDAFSGYASTTFFLPKSWKINLEGWYVTGMTAGYFHQGQMGSANANLTKTFADGKASLTLSVNDLFDTLRSQVSIYNNGIRTYHADQRQGGIGCALGFTWRFGQGTASSRRQVGKVDEADRL